MVAFVRDDQTWQRTATLTPFDDADGTWSIPAVDARAETAVVTGVSSEGGDGTGAGYVFQRTDSGWSDPTAVTPEADPDEGVFGRSAALGGEYLAIGTVPPPSAADTARGEVAVFSRPDGWTLQSRLRPGRQAQRVGAAVDLVDRTLIVGAPESDDGSGLAYAFRRTEAGWETEATLRPIRRLRGNRAGGHVAATSVEEGLLASVAGRETVSVFHRDEDGDWQIREEFGPDELRTTGGESIHVALDGRRLLAGVPRTTGDTRAAPPDAGAAFLWGVPDPDERLPPAINVVPLPFGPFIDLAASLAS